MSKGRIYTVSFAATSVAAAVDAFELVAADDKPIELVGIVFDQTGVADVGDAQEELLRWSVIRGFTTSGSGGGTPTPAKTKARDVAAGFTAETLNTTLAVTGTTETIHESAFNVRTGERFWWIPDTEPDCSQADTRIVVRLAAPADAITLSGTLYVREYG
jgi:hypothetical protein